MTIILLEEGKEDQLAVLPKASDFIISIITYQRLALFLP